MASFISIHSSSLVATLPFGGKSAGNQCHLRRIAMVKVPSIGGPRLVQLTSATKKSYGTLNRSKTTKITCSVAQPETLQIVQSTVAKQLSIDDSSVTPETKFADLGADSLDTVEILMTLEEKFGVSIGEGGAENISTVQDAADLIEKVKTGDA
ncbi:hypothetical protein QJS04_geneDACA013562 [Acorus gramineus]|uniref:Acyl carrier protein n=1 Tax=Acorus gramineus TaxID=55184 RepID=A0AAV9AF16_ACOGR|nr:hypothetical protein QJS04_geneDACA013562 [Acorus gramineus]